ncbi:hypothetical protein [Acanthopleuribacter pedis]|uniref:Tetratricopeptide repeat protein n=1 Tax=Acanthopleuribacter pedis TaxID=442870 RepID=A0A8J7QE55_9BACT|nr:hypothetical protein [Acanthopleuribacter pedis]MBO1322524.1 hypothetical protein [Acanthopleuribacter pedis]
MLKLFDALRTELAAFVEGAQHRALLLASSDNDIAFPLKVLREVEEGAPADVFMMYCDNFQEPSAYADVVMERLREEHQIAVEWQVADGRDPLPDLPESLFDNARAPQDRLVEAVHVVHGWFPPEGDHRLVWIAAPMETARGEAWPQFCEQLYRALDGNPWLRLIFRMPANLPKLIEKGKAPAWMSHNDVKLTGCDFGPKAMEESLAEQAEDPELDEDQRMNALMMLAVRDTGFNRRRDAEAKYAELLEYGQRKEDPSIKGMALMGLGDLYKRNNELNEAATWYECAVPETVASKQTMPMYLNVKGLADTYFLQRRFPEAEEAYLQAARLAQANQDTESFARMINGHAKARAKQKNWAGAVDRWDSAAIICRDYDHDDLLKEILPSLRKGYEKLNMNDHAKAIAAELTQLKTKGGVV